MFLLCRNVVIHTWDIKHRHKMTSHLCRYVSSVQKRLKWLVSLPAHIGTISTGENKARLI